MGCRSRIASCKDKYCPFSDPCDSLKIGQCSSGFAREISSAVGSRVRKPHLSRKQIRPSTNSEAADSIFSGRFVEWYFDSRPDEVKSLYHLAQSKRLFLRDPFTISVLPSRLRTSAQRAAGRSEHPCTFPVHLRRVSCCFPNLRPNRHTKLIVELILLIPRLVSLLDLVDTGIHLRDRKHKSWIIE